MPCLLPGRSLGIVLLVAAGLPLASCSSGVTLYPVKGQVFHGDSPAEGAIVVLHLKDGPADAPKPSGMVGADGAFTLKTHPHGDGAPAGEYVVMVTWYPPDARGNENARNKLPDLYALPTTSPLKATVKAGPTDLEPIRIPKKK